MFIETQFPQLWFAVQGTMQQLALLKARIACFVEDGLNLNLEVERTQQKLQEEFATVQPFAEHFTHSLALKAPNAGALKVLASRVEALDRFESRFDAKTAASHTAWDLNSAWADLEPQPEDISYMEILSERLDLALLKAQSKGAREIGEVILAVKNELSNFLMQFQAPDITAEFYAFQTEPGIGFA